MIAGLWVMSAAPAAEVARPCSEFAALVAKPAQLSELAIAGEEIEEGVWRIRGFDIDGDRVNDEMTRFCPASASIVPADPCSLEFNVSRTRKTFVLEEQRLYAIHYKSRVYVVAGRADSDTGPFRTDIYLLTSAGAKRHCSFK